MTEMVCVSPEGRITPGLHRPVDRRAARRAGRGSSTSCTPARTARIGAAARPLRPQGLDQADVGGHGRAARGGQLGGRRPLGAPLRRRTATCRASRPAPTWTRSSPSSSPPPPRGRGRASTCSSCTPRTATCCPPSSRRSPTGAPTSTADRWRTGCASRSRCSTPCAPPWPAHDAGHRAHLGDRLDAGRQHRATTPSRSPGPSSSTAPTASTSPPARSAKEEKPAFGRSYQTPFADRIRHEVAAPAGVAVIAVGRDLLATTTSTRSCWPAAPTSCALGRTHLYDPQWTLHAAAEQEYRGPGAEWPQQFRAGRRKPPTARTDAVRPRLALVREPETPSLPTHLRWTPAKVPASV